MLLVADETDCTRLVSGPTLNHTHRKPYIPLPPALPRFALPNEATEADDPSDAAATQQRPALGAVARPRTRRIVRRNLVADSTEEVQVEDILLEAYAEDPPPPPSRRWPVAPPVPTESARASIAMAIASAVPPPAQSAAVDELLRASAPSFAPHAPPQGQGFVAPQGYGYRPSGSDFESQSMVPVMMATTAPPPARPVFANANANARGKRVNRSAVVAIWSSLLVVLGVAFGASIVLGVKNGTYARLRDSAKAAALRAPSRSTPARAAAAAPAPALPDTQVVAPVAPAPVPPAPVVAPAVSVSSLSAPAIAADSSLVTFPAYAQSHRVFIDGRLVAVADGAPTSVKCGRHMVRIGSARKPRVLDFACGREVIVK